MMRSAAAIFLFVLIILPLGVKGLVLLHFIANRAYIVEHFCENKDKPQLHCEGKCYLIKQLRKADEMEHRLAVVFQWEDGDCNFVPDVLPLLPCPVQHYWKSYFGYLPPTGRVAKGDVFQPPDGGNPTSFFHHRISHQANQIAAVRKFDLPLYCKKL